MRQGEAEELKDYFQKQFDDVLIQEREDLYKIFGLIDRLELAENRGWD